MGLTSWVLTLKELRANSNRTLPIWLFDARLSVRDRLTPSRPDANLVTSLPSGLLNLIHLPLRTCNRCSMLDLMDKCAELTSLALIRGKYTS
jgi:hypothetical protein